MSFAFPLVRAGEIAPVVNWLRKSGRPVAEVLAQAHLCADICDAPDRLISLQHALDLLRNLGDSDGADIGWRLVSASGAAEMGPVSELMLGAPTPRVALTRLCVGMSRHNTHEQFALMAQPGGVVFTEQMLLNIDPAARHITQQYVAALLQSLCLLTGYQGAPLSRVEMAPHPRLGVAPLVRWLGEDVRISASRKMRIFLSDDVLDRPFLPRLVGAGAADPERFVPLRGAQGYSGTVLSYLEHLLDGHDVPSADWVAAAGGTSLRTMQRRLAEEGTSFSDLLDRVRRDRALQELECGQQAIGEIGSGLGYTNAQSFTRAVRRWSDNAPRAVRRAASE